MCFMENLINSFQSANFGLGSISRVTCIGSQEEAMLEETRGTRGLTLFQEEVETKASLTRILRNDTKEAG